MYLLTVLLRLKIDQRFQKSLFITVKLKGVVDLQPFISQLIQKNCYFTIIYQYTCIHTNL